MRWFFKIGSRYCNFNNSPQTVFLPRTAPLLFASPVLLSGGKSRNAIINATINDIINDDAANDAHDDVLLLLPNVCLKARAPSSSTHLYEFPTHGFF